MSKRTQWTTAAELDGAQPSNDEFSAEVSAAISELRERHGLSAPSCAPEGNSPGLVDQLRKLLPGVSRRGFLQLSGAAAVFGLAGCHQDPDTLVPFKTQPEGSVLGKPRQYSTVVRASGRPVPAVVTTYDGRPIKIDGNPDCPIGRGRADIRTQAALLDLYDPDRLQNGPLKKAGASATWSEIDNAVGKALASGTVGLITGPIDGPARRQLIADVAAAFGDRLRHAVFDPSATGGDAASEAFGDVAPPVWHLERACVLLHLGGDFLADQGLAGQVAFGDFRRGDGSAPGQVIAIEPVLSQTGSVADLRIRCAIDRVAWAAWAIADLVAKAKGLTLPEAISRVLDSERAAGFDKVLELRPVPVAAAQGKTLSEAAAAAKIPAWTGEGIPALTYAALRLLQAGPGKSLVYAGGPTHSGSSSASLLAAVHWLNHALGNLGSTVTFDKPASAILASDRNASYVAVRAQCAAGGIQTLITVGVNPAFSDPSYAAAVAKVGTIVAIAERNDETAQLAHWVAPALHELENWGDAEPAPGLFAVQQPCIRSLWDARAAEESLFAWTVKALGDAAPASFRQDVSPDAAELTVAVVNRAPLWQAPRQGVNRWSTYVQAVWSGQVQSSTGVSPAPAAAGVGFWNAALARGVVQTKAPAAAVPAHSGTATAPTAWNRDQEVRLVVTAHRILGLGEGAAANNAWLLEAPDPVSRITWDPYVALSPTDAGKLGVADNDVVTVSIGPVSAALPVHLQDGQHPGTAEVFLGWGRTAAGAVAALGRNADELPAFNAAQVADRWGTRVQITRTGKTFILASPQGHDRMEGRDIARDRVLGAAPAHGHHAGWIAGVDGKPGGRLSIHGSSIPVDGRRWGMTVDLSLCTGCNSCAVACSAENNVPVVGRDEVRRGRLMHWIRIDRYYSGKDRLDVETIHQPVMCQQCEKAPCEAVCPANATMHNEEGLNVQVYNRCIGTRYCANNCPYKARRFNWYEYSALRAGPKTGSGALSPLTRIVGNVQQTANAGAPSTTSPDERTHLPLQLMLNPDVTVRSRGVMEKCNFCLHRTRAAKEQERAAGTRLPDGAVQTACSQTCPTQAIVFGDLNDPAAAVSRSAGVAGGYKVLDEVLNTRPSVTYHPRLRHRPSEPDESAGEHAHAKEGA
ncbi:hypothetical protein LBMAG53_36150 [Planctomycetota bacterium]|nr:hypothetical protein LBMAG53_36150 [Planctomycetota bacterium]